MQPQELPQDVNSLLSEASERVKTASAAKVFRSYVFPKGSPLNAFIETWAATVYMFLGHALGPFNKEPLPEILALEDGAHASGANASFSPDSGRIRLHQSFGDQPGKILEKLTHEMLHAAIDAFPAGDPFYEEGYVDYSVWVLAHAPIWGQYRDAMIEAASYNIAVRRDRALLNTSDYDRKRWAGGFFASLSLGPHIITVLRMKKLESNYTW